MTDNSQQNAGQKWISRDLRKISICKRNLGTKTHTNKIPTSFSDQLFSDLKNLAIVIAWKSKHASHAKREKLESSGGGVQKQVFCRRRKRTEKKKSRTA